MTNARMGIVAGKVGADEWTRRVVPQTNLPAFTFWHCARVTDGILNFYVRGVPEIAERPPWNQDPVIGFSEVGAGVGLTLEDADAIARRVSIPRVLEYAAAIRAEASAWLKTVDDDFLDTVPDFASRRDASPVYGKPAAVASSRDLDGHPVWRVLMISCFGHVWSHLDEILLLVETQRAAEASGV